MIQAGPLAAPSATTIATAQRNYGAGGALALIGASSDASATTICASQSPGASAFTINGSKAISGVAYAGNKYLYITCAGNSSTRTVTVVGTDINGTAITEVIALTNAQSSASTKKYNTVISITPSGAVTGALTVGTTSGATLDVARKVLFTTTANESANTATVYGTNWSGELISETLTLVNASTVYTVLDYKTVYLITVASAGAGNISVGTNGIAVSPWVYLDSWSMSQIALQLSFNGVANATVQQTGDDPNDPTNPIAPASMQWVNHSDTALVGATSNQQSNYAYPPAWVRLVLNSSTGSGYSRLTINQAFSVGF
jgi:hypothetical protein